MAVGIRFECQPGCTECCTQRGFVYLTEADVERAAAFLNMTPGAFEQKYVFRSKHLRRLRISQQTRCFFLRDGGCAIHPAKPTQCRTFPFWPEIVERRVTWQRTARATIAVYERALTEARGPGAVARSSGHAPGASR